MVPKIKYERKYKWLKLTLDKEEKTISLTELTNNNNNNNYYFYYLFL